MYESQDLVLNKCWPGLSDLINLHRRDRWTAGLGLLMLLPLCFSVAKQANKV
jgi:hypothetical protein